MTPRRALAALAAPLLAVAGLALLPGGPARPVCAAAAAGHHVAVVVRHGNGSGFDAPGVCVTFTSASITVEQALQLASQQYGLEYATASTSGGMGDELCQVDNEPPSPAGGWNSGNCLGGQYWEVFSASWGGSWDADRVGISNQALSDGDAAGFSYGNQQPPPPSPAGICPAPAPTSSPAAAPSPRPVPASPAVRRPTGSPAVAPAAGTTPGPAQAAPLPSSGAPTAASSAAPPSATGVRRPSGAARVAAVAPWGLASAGAAVALMGGLLVVRVGRQAR